MFNTLQTIQQCLKILNVELAYYPAIQLRGRNTKRTAIRDQRDGSGGKVLVVRVQGPKFDPQNTYDNTRDGGVDLKFQHSGREDLRGSRVGLLR